jgi:hypothetical protein
MIGGNLVLVRREAEVSAFRRVEASRGDGWMDGIGFFASYASSFSALRE